MGTVLCWCVNFALSAPSPPQPGSARPASPPSDSDPGFVIKNVPSFAEPQPSLGWPQSPPTPQPSPRNVLLSRKNQNSKVFHIEVLNFDINAVMNKHYSEKVPTSWVGFSKYCVEYWSQNWGTLIWQVCIFSLFLRSCWFICNHWHCTAQFFASFSSLKTANLHIIICCFK